MSETVANQWRQDGNRVSENRYEGRQGLITRAARACFARRGVAKTSIADITREINITRELFYYYFPNKGAVVDAVIDGYVDDARALLEQYLDESAAAQAQTLTGTESLMVAIAALRAWLATAGDAVYPMVAQLAETGRWPSVSHRAAGEAASALAARGLVSPSAHDGLRVALVGVMTIMRYNADVSDEHFAQSILPLLG